MGERAHVGSAAWVEGPIYLSEFATGAFSGHGVPMYEQVNRPPQKIYRMNAAVVTD